MPAETMPAETMPAETRARRDHGRCHAAGIALLTAGLDYPSWKRGRPTRSLRST